MAKQISDEWWFKIRHVRDNHYIAEFVDPSDPSAEPNAIEVDVFSNKYDGVMFLLYDNRVWRWDMSAMYRDLSTDHHPMILFIKDVDVQDIDNYEDWERFYYKLADEFDEVMVRQLMNEI